MTNLRDQLTAAIEDARERIDGLLSDSALSELVEAWRHHYNDGPLIAAKQEVLYDSVTRWGDLRAVAAAWDEHVAACAWTGEAAFFGIGMGTIEAEARRLVKEQQG